MFHFAPAAKYPKEIRDVRDCFNNRETFLVNTLLTELHEEGAGGPRELHLYLAGRALRGSQNNP